MIRTIAIWVSGLLASGIFGYLVTYNLFYRVVGSKFGDLHVWGIIGGMFAFACLRLWLATPSKNSK
jgi:hypothetical protein